MQIYNILGMHLYRDNAEFIMPDTVFGIMQILRTVNVTDMSKESVSHKGSTNVDFAY